MANKSTTVCPVLCLRLEKSIFAENNKIVGAEGANGKTNEGELCA